MGETTACPSCGGKGTTGAFVDTATHGWFEPNLPCRRCKSTGLISRQQEEWMRIGGTHRTWRVGQWESIQTCAHRLGITPADVSLMENGRADPARLAADTPEELRHG